MTTVFTFGEQIPDYDFRVINERDARASAGIMFLLGILSLFSLFMFHSLFWAEVFSITFIIEFAVRVLISPKYAPYMALGSIIVSNQQPEWVEARPKLFAWALGLGLGVIMGYFIINNVMTPARLLVCLICLALLYMESVFGICLGCILYRKLNIKLEKCPGGVCETEPKYPANIGKKFLIVLLYGVLFAGIYMVLKTYKYSGQTPSPTMSQTERDMQEFEEEDQAKSTNTTDKDCTPPEYAIKMGHKEMWLEHHGCK